ncbi:MAG: hypothetical protein M1834_003140 [Cirrosporium novae-zelandiae]|nr:MAG: hypothetical protein M1834_003140 [Cirrosporium novae-zelandiae]
MSTYQTTASSTSMAEKAPSPLFIQGSTLEGGGQLVRNAVVLSCLTKKPIHIINIRSNRGRGGGLKSSHLAAVNFLMEVAAARVKGNEIGSRQLTFSPGSNQRLKKEYSIVMQSPGSIWLVFQAIYPYILFSGMAPEGHTPIRLHLTGGTNVSKSPSGEYITQVLLPTFQKMGLPPISLKIHKRGWTHGRPSPLGSATFTIHPLPPTQSHLPAFDLKYPGAITKIAITILAPQDVRKKILIQTQNALFLDVPTYVEVNEDSGDPKRLYLLLVAHTEHGYRLGRDWLYDKKITNVDDAIPVLVKQVVSDLTLEIRSLGCVDEYMEDQVVVFQALARGMSTVDLGRKFVDAGVVDEHGREMEEMDLDWEPRLPSLHTRTAMWVAERICGATFKYGTSWGVG